MNYPKSFLASVLIATVVLLPVAAVPRTAHAILPVHDAIAYIINGVTSGATTVSAGKDTKDLLTDYVLKPLALALGREAMKSITLSTVNWINGGFNGSPAFETDLKNSLRKLGDGVAQDFITQLTNEAAIRSPFSDQLITNVGAAYYLYSGRQGITEKLRYTLNQSAADDRAFLAGDFSQGGWNAWLSAFQNPANNPFGAQMIASQELARTVSTATNQRVAELGWGSGFLSWKGDCIDKNNTTPRDAVSAASAPATNSTPLNQSGNGGATGNYGIGTSGSAAARASVAASATSLSDKEGCLEHEIQTPGSFAAHKLNISTDVPIDQLLLAQSIDAIVGALAQQLISSVLGGGGLRNVSNPSAGGGASTLTKTNGPNSNQEDLLSQQEGLVAAIQTSITQITAWKKDSQTIAAAANAARQVCSGDATILTTIVEPARTKYEAAAKTADTALATLSGLSSKIQGQGVSNSTYIQVVKAYQQTIDGGAVPSTVEMSRVSADAKDSGTADPATLFTQLTYLATHACVPMGT